MGAWHSQLIEVLGAMGIREVRRLRGEVGRAIFMEDIEKEAFGDLARVSPAAGARMRHRAPPPGPRSRSRRTVEPQEQRRRGRSARRPTATATPWASTRSTAWPRCASCGRCVEVCQYGVHVKPEGYAFTLRPQDHLCIGPECAETDDSCVAQCPQKALGHAAQPQRRLHGRSALDERPDPRPPGTGRHRARCRRRTWSTGTAPRAAASTGCASTSKCRAASEAAGAAAATPARSTPAWT